MTNAEFLSTIAAHPVAKYVYSLKVGERVTVRGDDIGGESVFFEDGRWWVHDHSSSFGSLLFALDALLATIEPPKPACPPGFVIVDKPTVDNGSGMFLAAATNSQWAFFGNPAVVGIAWLDFDRDAIRKEERERCAKVCEALRDSVLGNAMIDACIKAIRGMM